MNGKPPGRTPQNLESKARPVIEAPVGLPAIDEPRLNLQVLGGEDLNTHAVEKPRSVRRNVGGLIRPVVELVVAEQPDVGHENAGIDVDPVQFVEVISAVRLGDIAISVIELPLAARGAGIVARRGL